MMKSPSCLPAAEDSAVLLTEEPLHLESAIGQVSGSRQGAVVVFAGTVRELENGRPIASITYQAYHGMAEKQISKIVGQAQELWAVRLVVHHRFGKVRTAEPSLVVACSGVHRSEAFQACQFAVDQIKLHVPIWKVGFEWA